MHNRTRPHILWIHVVSVTVIQPQQLAAVVPFSVLSCTAGRILVVWFAVRTVNLISTNIRV